MSARKKAKLEDLARGTHLSTAAKSKLLKDVRELGMPEAISETTERRQRKSQTHADTEFGPVICWRTLPAAEDGAEDIKLPFQHPFAMLSRAIAISAEFMHLFFRVVTAAMGSLRIILYGDEVTPGQALAKANSRKTFAMYWSFADFGYPLLSNEKLWFCLGTIHTNTIKKIKGHTSALYREALKLFFGRPGTADMRDGIMFRTDRGGYSGLIFGWLWMLIADERGHKFSLGCAGATGTKACPVCTNITFKGSRRLPDPTGFLLPISEPSFSEFKLQVPGGGLPF